MFSAHRTRHRDGSDFGAPVGEGGRSFIMSGPDPEAEPFPEITFPWLFSCLCSSSTWWEKKNHSNIMLFPTGGSTERVIVILILPAAAGWPTCADDLQHRPSLPPTFLLSRLPPAELSPPDCGRTHVWRFACCFNDVFERSDVPTLAANGTYSLPARLFKGQIVVNWVTPASNCIRQTLIWLVQRAPCFWQAAFKKKRPVCNWVKSSLRFVVLIFLNTFHLDLSVISALVIYCWGACVIM